MYSKSNENTHHYYDYLKCNLNLINEINDRKKNLEKMNAEQQNKLQGELYDSKKLIIEQQDKVKDLESKIELLQNQVNDSTNVNNEQLHKMKNLEKLITQLQNKLENQEKEHKKLFLIKGQIVASVEK